MLLVAGALKPASKLLKLALGRAQPRWLWPATAGRAGGGAAGARHGAREGLIVRPDVAARLAEACAGNRAVLSLELQKLALYLDAAPERPQPLDHDALDAVGAAAEEGDLSRLVDSVGNGDRGDAPGRAAPPRRTRAWKAFR